MGKSYSVPRNVKGESRILYIFSIKSFVTTLAAGLIGALVWYLFKLIINIPFGPGLVITLIFGGAGYILGAVTIPDSPMMGALRKAGGENVGNIVFRLLTFKRRRKIYIYNLDRKKNIMEKENPNSSEKDRKDKIKDKISGILNINKGGSFYE